MQRKKKKARYNAHFTTTKNVFTIAHVKTSLRLWNAAPMYPGQRKESLQCIVKINARSFLVKKTPQDPPLRPERNCNKLIYVIFDAHAPRCILRSKNRAMPVHAGTQRWILDSALTSLTFALSCIPIPLKKLATMHSFRCAPAGESQENTGHVAPQTWLSPFFQRCYLHLFACAWTCNNDSRLNQPQAGNPGHEQGAKSANPVPRSK